MSSSVSKGLMDAVLIALHTHGPRTYRELAEIVGRHEVTVNNVVMRLSAMQQIRPLSRTERGEDSRHASAKVWTAVAPQPAGQPVDPPVNPPDHPPVLPSAAAPKGLPRARQAGDHTRAAAAQAKALARQQALRDKTTRAAEREIEDQETAVFEALLDADGPQTNQELAALCVLPEHVVAAALLRMLVRAEVRRLTPMTLGYPLRLESTNRHAWAVAYSPSCSKPAAAAAAGARSQTGSRA